MGRESCVFSYESFKIYVKLPWTRATTSFSRVYIRNHSWDSFFLVTARHLRSRFLTFHHQLCHISFLLFYGAIVNRYIYIYDDLSKSVFTFPSTPATTVSPPLSLLNFCVYMYECVLSHTPTPSFLRTNSTHLDDGDDEFERLLI